MMNRSREDVTFDINDVECIRCQATMVWSDETRDWTCPNCKNTAYQTYEDCGPDEIYYEFGPDDDYDEIYEEK